MKATRAEHRGDGGWGGGQTGSGEAVGEELVGVVEGGLADLEGGGVEGEGEGIEGIGESGKGMGDWRRRERGLWAQFKAALPILAEAESRAKG
ncbi:hypothetical protein AAC387_Pa04g3032 [Persea americana]